MSKEIIDAAASYFGMDPAELAQGTMAAGANGLRFTFTVEVGADGYIGIADRMRAMREPEEPDDVLSATKNESGWVTLPSLQEVMRDPVKFMGRPECTGLIAKACSMSKLVRDQVEGASKVSLTKEVWSELSNLDPAARKVVHVDAPADEQEGLPPAVWVEVTDLDSSQVAMASDERQNKVSGRDEYLLQVSMLRPEQIAKGTSEVPK